MSDFQQTVNLKDSLKPQPRPQPQPAPKLAPKPVPAAAAMPKPTPVAAPRRKAEGPVLPALSRAEGSRAEGIDQVYRDEVPEPNEFKTIQRARPRMNMEIFYKRVSLVLALLLLAAVGYFMFNRNRAVNPVTNGAGSEAKWYMVKLDNNEVYYGHIENSSADPIVINNVYYNYDQLNSEVSEPKEGEAASPGLRLVKRGKEAQGGDGSMAVVRAHVVSLEPLAEDSKVLKAILDYEKQ